MHDHGVHLAATAGASDLALAGTLLVAGLLGGLTHCTTMCGPFVLAQVAAGLEHAGPRYGTLARLSGGALVPYHLGRLTTYVALGALGGALAGRAAVAAESRWLVALLLVVAAGAFLLWSIEALAGWRPRWRPM
ncbi:MAG: sulfite exporter TauE/SafE family protein, partial [Alphaproteobacteria bacterium]